MNAPGWVILGFALLSAYFFTLNASYLTLLALGAIANRRTSRELRATELQRIEQSSLTVPVTIVIPAFNEQGTVADTIRSALDSRFPELEVLVVDDGSTDGMLAELRETFQLEPEVRLPLAHIPTAPVRAIYRSRIDERLWVISKDNGGKADASNVALNLARYRYLFVTDADGVFEPDALVRASRVLNFDPGRVVALGVTLRPLNGCEVHDGRIVSCVLPKSWAVRFQTIEYASVFLANRLGWGALNAVPVVSGGGGAWRKDTLLELGGFSTETTHEDLEMTMRLHARLREAGTPYRIAWAADAVVYTEVPSDWRGLYRQRKRWQRTLYEALWRERRMMFNPRYGMVGMLQMPHLLLYEALGPFIELAGYAFTIVVFVTGLVEGSYFLAFLAVAAGLNAVVRLASLVLDLVFYHRRSIGEVAWLSLASLLEYWVYRPFMLVARVPGFFEFLKGHHGHERAERGVRAARAPAPLGSHP